MATSLAVVEEPAEAGMKLGHAGRIRCHAALPGLPPSASLCELKIACGGEHRVSRRFFIDASPVVEELAEPVQLGQELRIADAARLAGGDRELDRIEAEMAQRLIMKPDSVLELSCFESQEQLWKTQAAIFTESTTAGGISSTTMDRAIDLVMTNAVLDGIQGSGSRENYLSPNFTHFFLGGTFEAARTGPCEVHNAVWHAAKCENINPFHFFRIRNLENADYRIFPDRAHVRPKGGSALAALLSTIHP